MMKHDHSRRHNRRHASPAVICLPSQLPPYTPPRAAAETSSAMAVPDDAGLDAELLAHKNIFEVEPRMSRQARRKALRAEKKAARRSATDRFLVGAPSLPEAATAFAMVKPEVAVGAETFGPMMPEPAGIDAEPDVTELAVGDVLVAERPEHEPEEHELLEIAETVEVEIFEAGMAAPDPVDEEPVEAEPIEAAEEATVPLDTIAQMISATGPLIVTIAAQPAPLAPDCAGLAANEDEPAETALEAMSAAIVAEIAATEAPPEPVVPEPVLLAGESMTVVATPVADEPAVEVPIEAITTPLPRDRALVPARRSWLMRLIPWLGRPKALAPEPALAQLQELRFELATALRRLDQILDRAA